MDIISLHVLFLAGSEFNMLIIYLIVHISILSITKNNKMFQVKQFYFS